MVLPHVRGVGDLSEEKEREQKARGLSQAPRKSYMAKAEAALHGSERGLIPQGGQPAKKGNGHSGVNGCERGPPKLPAG